MRTHRLIRWIGRQLRTALPLLLVLVARSSFASHYQVPSGSMEPTLKVGDRIFVDKRAYGLRLPLTEQWISESPPARGDVVVFSHPVTGEVLVKRLIGVPGDVLEMADGALYVNGVQATQRVVDGRRLESLAGVVHLLNMETDQGPPFRRLRIPPRQYFMSGDHRGNSSDSRMWGFVAREKLLGKATAILYSPRDGLDTAERFWIPLDPRLPPDARLLRTGD